MVNGIPFDKTTRNFQVEESHVTYYLFTRENIEHYITLNPSNPVQLNTSKRIVFIVHGWTENRRKLWYNEIKNAFLRKDDVYVVQVDYEKPASQNYVDAVSAVPDVGKFAQMSIIKRGRADNPKSALAIKRTVCERESRVRAQSIALTFANAPKDTLRVAY